MSIDLVLTTGGTGPAPRDVTPEATLAIADKEMPGFGEQMRQISLRFVPTAILSRQVAVIRGQSLIFTMARSTKLPSRSGRFRLRRRGPMQPAFAIISDILIDVWFAPSLFRPSMSWITS